MLSFLFSFIFSPAILFANIPIFTIFKFQLVRTPLSTSQLIECSLIYTLFLDLQYRILTSPLMCENLLNLVFAFVSVLDLCVVLV